MKRNLLNTCSRPLILCFALCIASLASAGEDENVSTLIAVGKVSANACRIKLQSASFSNSCPAASYYKEAYFTCNGTDGKEFLAIALSAYTAGKNVRVVTNACSQYGSSVANLSALSVE